MAEYIEKDEALAIIENKQREICPMGRYSRNSVYGSDRETFDDWQEILDEIDAIPAADVAPVRYGEWIERAWRPTCSLCGFSGSLIDAPILPFKYCPNCGAKMDGGTP